VATMLTAEADWPRISRVAPVLNSGKYVEETICSVLTPCYPNLEYFTVHGGSTDRRQEVMRKFETEISGRTSEPDKGDVRRAEQKIDPDERKYRGMGQRADKLHTAGLRVVGSVLRDFPQVDGLTGHLRCLMNMECRGAFRRFSTGGSDLSSTAFTTRSVTGRLRTAPH
jgi:cellulose synthase/poly-beta-1,6-N-acetylglucosamine synthase-like glycosyltransferase